MKEVALKVFYDADCSFCNSCRTFVTKRSKPGQVLFLSIKQSKYASFRSGSIVVENEHGLNTKYEACLIIAERMFTPWPLVAKVLHFLPNRLGDWGYDLLANKRGWLMAVIKWWRR